MGRGEIIIALLGMHDIWGITKQMIQIWSEGGGIILVWLEWLWNDVYF